MKGDGIMMTRKREKAMLHGSGITISKGGPTGSVRGIRYLQTTAPSLSRLNTVALVFEIEIGQMVLTKIRRGNGNN